LADDYLDAGELSWSGVPPVLALSCVRGAARGSSRRDRGGESSLAAGRPCAEGRGVWRFAARGGGGALGRSASGAGYRGPVLRTNLVDAPGTDLVARCGLRDERRRRARPGHSRRYGRGGIPARGIARELAGGPRPP